MRASRIGPQRLPVKLARLRRFRLGADNSPAPSSQALQPGQFDEQPCGRLSRNGFDKLTAFGPFRDAQAIGAGPPGLATCGMRERTAPMLPTFPVQT